MQALRLVGFAVAVLVAMPTHAAVDDVTRQDAARKIAGKKLYAGYCASCHGETAAGNGPAAAGNGPAAAARKDRIPDFTTPQAVVAYDFDRMLAAVVTGHDEASRSQWSKAIDAETAKNVISYMREAHMLPAPVADASIGRVIFAKTCSVCHGDRGDGATWAKHGLDPSPFNFTSQKAKELSRRHMINTVTYGSPRTAMMGFSTQFSREEIAAVVDYIRSTFVAAPEIPEPEKITAKIPTFGNPRLAGLTPRPGAPDTAQMKRRADVALEPADLSAPMPDGLIGNVTAGRDFFNANCFLCHGKEGRGDGPRAYFINPKPANLTDPSARHELNRPALFKKISMGVNATEMPAWSKVLTNQQIADVAEYVFTTFILPDPTTASKATEGKEQTAPDSASKKN